MNAMGNGGHAVDHGDGPLHSVQAQNRREITVTGVREVVSFDETGVLLVTTCGQLSVEGEDLHVTTLNTRDGVVVVTGILNGLLYENETTPEGQGKRSRFGRWFR
jgi:sporulation protein YabP